MQRTKRAIEFYKRVLPVLAAAYKAKELEFKLKKTPEEEQQQAWQELDEWGSTRIAETIHDMKGFYVKTGQVISTRVDLFPEAYILANYKSSRIVLNPCHLISSKR